MNMKPIIFNTEMVQAILDGSKTQTRRIVKCKDGTPFTASSPIVARRFISDSNAVKQAPCAPGDILWVRETWSHGYIRSIPNSKGADTRWLEPTPVGRKGGFAYRAEAGPLGELLCISWKPSIHMPKEAARIFLRIKDVRVERLQDMDEEAAIAEGFADSPTGTDSPLERFCVLWDKTVKRDELREYGYHANPWVWVIEFERCEKPEGWC